MEFLHKVKYGGAVGKKTVITVVVLIVLAIALLMLWPLRGPVWAVLLIVGAAVLIFFGSLSSIDKTLVAHPELALMDGTEILALRKAEMATKSKTVVDIMPAVANPHHPTSTLPESAVASTEEEK